MIETIVAVVTGLVGLNFIWHSVTLFRGRAQPATFEFLEGEIESLQPSPIPRPRRGWRAVMPAVVYRTPEGETKRFLSSVGQYPSPYVVGQKVSVRLAGDPPSPEIADVTGAVDRAWLDHLGFGILFCAVAAFAWYFDRVTAFLDRLQGQ